MSDLTANQKEELRARTLRLIKGPPRVNDLHRILLGVRTRTGDGELIQELADFVAHPDRRDTGFNTQRIRNMFHLVRFKVWHMTTPMDLSRLPPNFPLVLQAAFDLVAQRFIRKDTGFNRSRTQGIYRDLKKRFSKSPDGTYRASALNADELSLLRSLTNYIVVAPSTGPERLVIEFGRVLVRNGIIDQREVERLSSLKQMLALFMTVSMHTCRIEISENDFAELSADPFEGKISVCATAPTQRSGVSNPTIFVFPIFETGLPLTPEWCDPSLLKDRNLWKGPLELTDEIKIKPL